MANPHSTLLLPVVLALTIPAPVLAIGPDDHPANRPLPAPEYLDPPAPAPPRPVAPQPLPVSVGATFVLCGVHFEVQDEGINFQLRTRLF